MSGAENDANADPPLTVELLADLQGGLLDDDAAARIRKRVREDPQAQRILQALNQVRRDIAAAGTAPTTETPPALVDRLATALGSARSNSTAAHSARPHTRTTTVIAGMVGLGAMVAAIGLGTAALVDAPQPTPSAPITAEHLTVSTPPVAIPLSVEQIFDLLNHAPDYGPLSDPMRRASCLSGLGYPTSTPVLGAQPIDIKARQGMLLVMPGDAPGKLAIIAVALDCSAADTGLLASTAVPRP
jgi:hypothetical protein